uniref:anoctamin-4-like n=1 Tax=Ciona intestinalis TaxID=7719 RepID=UPI00089DB0CA|nr:anoctamin-4-like [Ciona intestinalis]|eukprot:XP_026692266.1 anoctamin-4-like [Ciona intestinalis]
MNTFRDGKSSIDYILVYKNDDEKEKHREWRRNFEANLEEEGLRLETDWMADGGDDSADVNGINFVKIHASWDALCRWAEIGRMKKPFAKNDIFKSENSLTAVEKFMTCCSKDSIKYAYDTHEKDESYFTATFDRKRLDSFIMTDRATFFTPTERYRLVHEILRVTGFGEDCDDIGMTRLLSDGVYLDAYPPHDGAWKPPAKEGSNLGPRQALYWIWARPGAWARPQPLELIRMYFGEKIAIYFAWLGFYTMMLVPAAVFGIIVFLYGLFSVGGEETVQAVCNSNLTVCPVCETCSFDPLKTSCTYSKISYVFDNTGTVVFAFVMSIWATFFIELWKRQRARLSYRWGTQDFEEEEDLVRPEFIVVSDKKKLNPVTGKLEPALSTKLKARGIAFSVSTLFFMLVLVVIALIGVIVYRTISSVLAYQATSGGIIQRNIRLIISITASIINFIIITILDVIYNKLALKLTNLEAPRTRTEFEDSYTLKMFYFKRLTITLLVVIALIGVIVYRTISSVLAYQATSGGIIQRNIRLIISITASIINFIIITILDVIYNKLALKLTNLEAPRTRTEFEDSYTLKMFLFQAVNYYSSTVYAAFFKGRFAGSPYRYHTMFGYRLEECDPTGCLIDVCINLAIVMILKQALNNTKELLIPVISSWLARRKAKKAQNKAEPSMPNAENVDDDPESPRSSNVFLDNPAFQDYPLSKYGDLGLFSEYLEMVIQFGFITLFVAAFPLAPFFALLNNIIEIRLDAYKFVTQLRRVPPLRCNDIGMWLSILQSISTISVLTNGLVIGITSSFIPKTVYSLLYGPCASGNNAGSSCLSGFIDSSLGEIGVKNISVMNHIAHNFTLLPETCRFRAFEPTPILNSNTNQLNYWHVFAGRLIFLLIFEHIVFGLKTIVDLLISDVPTDLAIASRRQKLLEVRMFYNQDASALIDVDSPIDNSNYIKDIENTQM